MIVYERITVVLTEHEMKKLRMLAQRELRRPRDQAAYIIRNALILESEYEVLAQQESDIKK